MSPSEAQALLAIAASFDNRKPDPDAATAWSHALDGLRFIDARDAIVAHYRTSSEWLMPSMIHSAVKKIRDARIAAAGPQTPPAGLTDAQELVWTRDANRRIADGEEIGQTREVGTRTFAELKGKVPELPAPPPVKREPDAATRDAKRAEIRRELHEGRRPVEVAEPLDDDDPEARPAVAEVGSGCAA